LFFLINRKKLTKFGTQILFLCVINARQTERSAIINNNKKTIRIMAEVMETQKHYASNAKANAGLTTGK
jgi:hypothetical protein